ncbi:MAG: hypothetical protein EON54_15070 [Alcaligenaceae bacterium]|nr:MAG: hypothetical protein EON54_15070 [Alcaligenaceae bacterium]
MTVITPVSVGLPFEDTDFSMTPVSVGVIDVAIYAGVTLYEVGGIGLRLPARGYVVAITRGFGVVHTAILSVTVS